MKYYQRKPKQKRGKFLLLHLIRCFITHNRRQEINYKTKRSCGLPHTVSTSILLVAHGATSLV